MFPRLPFEQIVNRFLPVILTIGFLSLIYLFVVMPIEQRREDVIDEIDSLNLKVVALKNQANQRPSIERALKRLDESGNQKYLLEQDAANTAAAALRERLSASIRAGGRGSNCAIESMAEDSEDGADPFASVSVIVELNCDLAGVYRLIHNLESSVPLLYVDQLSLWRKDMRWKPTSPEQHHAPLSVRFRLKGYLSTKEKHT